LPILIAKLSQTCCGELTPNALVNSLVLRWLQQQDDDKESLERLLVESSSLQDHYMVCDVTVESVKLSGRRRMRTNIDRSEQLSPIFECTDLSEKTVQMKTLTGRVSGL